MESDKGLSLKGIINKWLGELEINSIHDGLEADIRQWAISQLPERFDDIKQYPYRTNEDFYNEGRNQAIDQVRKNIEVGE